MEIGRFQIPGFPTELTAVPVKHPEGGGPQGPEPAQHLPVHWVPERQTQRHHPFPDEFGHCTVWIRHGIHAYAGGSSGLPHFHQDRASGRGGLCQRCNRVIVPGDRHQGVLAGQEIRWTPPQTGTSTPVMNPARSEARNATTFATSSGTPR